MFEKETPEIREKAARELARCHRCHLVQELKKSDKLLSNMTTEGVTFEQHTKNMLAELEELFPGLSDDRVFETDEFSPNIMRDWYEMEARLPEYPPYEESSFKLMNVAFLEHIRYISDPSEECRLRLMDVVTSGMVKTRLIDRGFSFRYLIRGESLLWRLMERRFQALGYEPLEAYRAVIERMGVVFTDAWFTYYYQIAVAAQARSDKLLRNILPESLALELREDRPPKPLRYDSATVVFTDFVGFSRTAGGMTAEELVLELDRHFSAFDTIIDKYGLEKLKTIGDAYMFAGGIPEERETHALDCVKAALEIRDYMLRANENAAHPWPVRIGVHTGPVVAGIIGHKKFSYDIWGNSVNIASRMESSGDPDSVNISEHTWNLVKASVTSKELGTREIKNCGTMRMFAVVGLRGQEEKIGGRESE